MKRRIEKLIEYMTDAEQKHFWENCQCSDEVQMEENFYKCTCDENKNHIYQTVKEIEDWLNSPSCFLVDSEEVGEAFCDKCSMDMKFDDKGNCIVCGTEICEDCEE